MKRINRAMIEVPIGLALIAAGVVGALHFPNYSLGYAVIAIVGVAIIAALFE